MNNSGKRADSGAALGAVPLRADKIGISNPILSIEARQKLALIASISHFNAGEILFHEGDQATCIFNIVSWFTMRSRRWFRSMQISNGTSKKTACTS